MCGTILANSIKCVSLCVCARVFACMCVCCRCFPKQCRSERIKRLDKKMREDFRTHGPCQDHYGYWTYPTMHQKMPTQHSSLSSSQECLQDVLTQVIWWNAAYSKEPSFIWISPLTHLNKHTPSLQNNNSTPVAPQASHFNPLLLVSILIDAVMYDLHAILWNCVYSALRTSLNIIFPFILLTKSTGGHQPTAEPIWQSEGRETHQFFCYLSRNRLDYR